MTLPAPARQWRAVTGATEVENSARRARRSNPVPAPSHGWHWRLTLACGHRETRPCRQRRSGGMVDNVPAPRRVHCFACGAAAAKRA